MATEEEQYEAAKTLVVESLIAFCEAADATDRHPQLALAEAMGAFAAAAGEAQTSAA